MLTLKLKIKSVSDKLLLDKYIFQATGLFMKLYNNFELSEDKNYRKELLREFNLFDITMLRFCVEDVKAKLNRRETTIEKRKQNIADIKKSLQDEELYRKTKYKLQNKIHRLEKNIDNNICFGGKGLLRKITKASQEARYATDKKEKEQKTKLYNELLAEFRAKRNMGIYLLGTSERGGNRKVRFHLLNNKIIFKPSIKTHIEITFTSRRDKTLLAKIQEMCNAKTIPITVRIDANYIYLSYDEALAAGYAFDETEFKRTLVNHNITSKEGRKETWKMFMQKLTERKLTGKVAGRYACIDINPQEIGFVIGDKKNDAGEFTVLHKQLFDLSHHSKKLDKSSDDSEQIYQNNKRKHEIKEVWKQIFQICYHYKCYNFVMEDLEFKAKASDSKPKEANRKTRNIWHRDLTTKLITKWTNIIGMNVIKINPCYSSFIGNLVYKDYDPIAATLELLRRGIVKYIKGSSLYPDIRSINQEKLDYLLGENVPCQAHSLKWKELYSKISHAGLRYRNKDKSAYSWRANYLNNFERSGVLCMLPC